MRQVPGGGLPHFAEIASDLSPSTTFIGSHHGTPLDPDMPGLRLPSDRDQCLSTRVSVKVIDGILPGEVRGTGPMIVPQWLSLNR
jgi:hypothetical protein